MIITNPTLFYGPLPTHLTVPIAEDATPEEFARVGRAAGDRCGREFVQTYPLGTNKADPLCFFGGVLDALDGRPTDHGLARRVLGSVTVCQRRSCRD
jgi:hypothetical protein